jgi:hypothetical protein
MSFETNPTPHTKHRNAADKKAEESLRCKGETDEQETPHQDWGGEADACG